MPQPPLGRDIAALRQIMADLRTPESGCPWDLEQTFATIAPYTIEEAYEVADAIERGKFDELCDELGDLLLQVVYHAQMASEVNAFSFDDVVAAICEKMIRRHPHVYGEGTAKGQSSLAKDFWEDMKAKDANEPKRSEGRRRRCGRCRKGWLRCAGCLPGDRSCASSAFTRGEVAAPCRKGGVRLARY